MGPVGFEVLESRLREGDRLLLDTSTLIAYFHGGEPVSHSAIHILDALVQSGRNPAVVSTVTVMELLVRPLRGGATGAYNHVLDFVDKFPHLTVLPVDLHVAQEAASVRAAFRLAAPDALVVASGLVSQVHHLVTNDSTWSRKLQPLASRINVCHLDHFR